MKPKKINKESIINYSILFFFILFLLVGEWFIVDYFHQKRNECISDPLVFGARELTNTYGYEFYGQGRFNIPNSVIVSFNSSGKNVQDFIK